MCYLMINILLLLPHLERPIDFEPPGSPILSDSLMLSYTGGWPFGSANEAEYDFGRDLVFCSSGGGVYVMDCSTPEDPVILSSSTHCRGFVTDLCYSEADSILYITAGEAGLEIWDLTDPLFPVRLSSLQFPYELHGVAISGDLACVSSIYSADFYTVDITDREDPAILGSCDLSGFAGKLEIQGDHAFVEASGAGLVVVDISDPSSPFEAADCPISDFAAGLMLQGNYAYMTSSSYLRIYDIQNPEAPALTGSCYFNTQCGDIWVQDDLVALERGSVSLSLVDVTDPYDPVPVGELDTDGTASGVAMNEEGQVFLCTLEEFHVIDALNPALPQLISSFKVPGPVYGLCIDDELAYLATCNDGLRILNVSEPDAPYEIGSVQLASEMVYSVAAENGLACAAGYDALPILDVSEPDSPVIIADMSQGRHSYEAAMSGSIILVAQGVDDLCIIDASDPYAPVEASRMFFPGDVNRVNASGTTGFVASRYTMYIIDFSDPYAPVELYAFTDPGAIYDMALAEYQVVLTDNQALRLVDVVDPGNPFQTGDFHFDEIVDRIAVSEDEKLIYAVFENGSQGADIRVISYENPYDLQEVGYYTGLGTVYTGHSEALGNKLFLASQDLGLGVYTFGATGIEDGESNGGSENLILSPNPCPGGSSAGFILPGAESTEVYIHDMTGRQIMHMVLVPTEGNGFQFSTACIPTGIYTVRTVTEGITRTGRMVILGR